MDHDETDQMETDITTQAASPGSDSEDKFSKLKSDLCDLLELLYIDQDGKFQIANLLDAHNLVTQTIEDIEACSKLQIKNVRRKLKHRLTLIFEEIVASHKCNVLFLLLEGGKANYALICLLLNVFEDIQVQSDQGKIAYHPAVLEQARVYYDKLFNSKNRFGMQHVKKMIRIYQLFDLQLVNLLELLHFVKILMKQNLQLCVYVVIQMKLCLHLDVENLILTLCSKNKFQLCEELLEYQQDRKLTILFVNRVLEMGDIRLANRYVRNFQLDDMFPNLRLDVSKNTLERLVMKEQYTVAISIAENNQELLVYLLKQLLLKNMQYLVCTLARTYNLGEQIMAELPLDPLVVEQQRQLALETELHLQLSWDHVHMVDSVESLSTAIARLSRTLHIDADVLRGTAEMPAAEHITACKSLVGLDCEWRPAKKSGVSYPVSIMQLSTAEDVFVFDFLHFYRDKNDLQALDHVLSVLMLATNVIKLGFDWKNDTHMIQKCYSECKFIYQTHSLFDLQALVVHCDMLAKFTASRPLNGRGLRSLVFTVLGKKLNKLQQMSKWDRRPLNSAQLHYAALDAYCLIQIFTSIFDLESDSDRYHSFVVDIVHHEMIYGDKQAKVVLDMLSSRCRGTELNVSKKTQSKNQPLDRFDFKILNLGIRTKTCLQSATALGCRLDQVVKSLAFFLDAQPVMVLLAGGSKVDVVKLRRCLFTPGGANQLRMASEQECKQVFGYPPGCLSPFELRCTCRVLVDRSLWRNSAEVYLGCGITDHLLYCSSVDNVKLVLGEAVEVDISQDSDKQAPQQQLSQQSASASAPHDVELKFICDNMLGKVARMLRALGYDTLTAENAARRVDHVRYMKQLARQEGRVFVTVDRKLAEIRPHCNMMVLNHSIDPEVQIKEVCIKYGVKFDSSNFLSRCTVCNSAGYNALTKHQVIPLIPLQYLGILESCDEFFECKLCKKIYWEGPGFFRHQKKIKALFQIEST